MHNFVLQNWLTIAGASASPGSSVSQEEQSWVDLSPFQDVVLYVHCTERGGGGTATIAFQTAPSKDESLFQTMASATLTGSTGVVTVVPALMLTASVPLARYVRWKITGPSGAAWDATFRVLGAANAPGN